METVLITGVEGMVGSHMIDHFFKDRDVCVIGTYYKSTQALEDVKHKAKFVKCDIRNFKKVYKIINKYKPDKIFHLAAQSYPTVSLKKPAETMDVNVNGTVNVFESVKLIRGKDLKYDPVVVVACSSAEYGFSLTPSNVPVSEEVQLLPLHPYGVSKVAQDLLAFQYYQNYGIKSVRVRIFNTTGPRKVDDVCADFTKRAVLFKKGLVEKIVVGNLESRRAIADVRDLIVALVLLSEKGRHGDVYNVSGEKVYKIGDIIPIIEKCISRKLDVEVDERLLRPTDEPVIYGDSSKLKNDTGWRQKISLEETITDMILYWEKVLK